eukprot:1253760-Pyramimonas_sp.AAC.1
MSCRRAALLDNRASQAVPGECRHRFPVPLQPGGLELSYAGVAHVSITHKPCLSHALSPAKLDAYIPIPC